MEQIQVYVPTTLNNDLKQRSEIETYRPDRHKETTLWSSIKYTYRRILNYRVDIAIWGKYFGKYESIGETLGSPALGILRVFPLHPPASHPA